MIKQIAVYLICIAVFGMANAETINFPLLTEVVIEIESSGNPPIVRRQNLFNRIASIPIM